MLSLDIRKVQRLKSSLGLPILSKALILASLIAPLAIGTATADTDDISPPRLYALALRSMSAMPVPSFYAFSLTIDQRLDGRERVETWNVAERTVDGLAHLHGDTGKATSGNLLIRPDLFIGVERSTSQATKTSAADSSLHIDLEDPASPAPALAVIGRVVAPSVRYDVSRMRNEDITGCGTAIVLKLIPFRNPERYNLRQLWLDGSTYRICRAVAVWGNIARINDRPIPVTVQLDLDSQGRVVKWSTSGKGQGFLIHPAFEATASYEGLTESDIAPPGWGL